MSAELTTDDHPDLGLLYRFIDGDLLDVETAELEAHLQECSTCRESYRRLLTREHSITDLLLDAARAERNQSRVQGGSPSPGKTAYPMMPVTVPTTEPTVSSVPQRHRHLGIIAAAIVVVSLWGYLLSRWLGGPPPDAIFNELRLTTRVTGVPEDLSVQKNTDVVSVDYEFEFFVQLSLIEAGQVAVYHRRAAGDVALIVPAPDAEAPTLEPGVSWRLPAADIGLLDSQLGGRGTVIVIPFRRAPARESLIDTARWLETAAREQGSGTGRPDWRQSLLRRFPSARLLGYRVEDLDRL